MRIRHFIILCICLTASGNLFAQWSKQDSVWLQGILSGNEEIKLKPEVLDAIEKGTLLNTDIMQPKDQLRQSPAELPLSKDFTGYIKPLNAERMIDPLTIPPAVFMRYGLKIPLPTVYRAFIVSDDIKKNGVKPSGISFDDSLKQLFSPKERKKAQARRNANAWKNYNTFP